MPVVTVKDNSTLQVNYIKGQDENGKNILTSKSYKGVKAAAQDQDLYDCAVAISNLQQKPINFVRRIDSSIITE